MEAANDGHASKNSGQTMEKKGCPAKGEQAKSPEKHQTKKEVNEPRSEDELKMDDSPVMGLLTVNKSTSSVQEEIEGIEKKEVPSESTIKKAIQKRGAYFKANSEEITMARVRRLLEEDLELNKNTLDPFKKLITEQVEKALRSLEASESVSSVKKQSSGKASHTNASKKISAEGSADSLNSNSDEDDELEDEVKSKKKAAPKGKVMNSEGLKKRKRPAKETKVSSKKQNKQGDMTSKENSDGEDGGNVSEDGQSQSSADKPVKQKELSTPAYGIRVEQLKSVIKSCGMSVAPSVYKRVKQVPEAKREAFLIKELEGILSKEGLSANPNEKDGYTGKDL
ncbi:unnamed protein product [Ilex paraguariensis]|uniref:Histone chaperone domain-containing protein n=1 Tax=Ilex paraguariensis TaxID=185542 RepID=A0ABC8TLW3_9AQUA